MTATLRIGFSCLLLFVLPASVDAANFAQRPEVQDFIREMHEKHGFASAALTRAFARTKSLPAVIKAIAPPADPSTRSWQSYRARFVEQKRIALGLGFWKTHSSALAKASERYGVPEEIVVAIIGVETIYGKNSGHFGTLAALATLAFDYPEKSSPRATFFRRELEELLLLAREMRRDPLWFTGSYAGALGLPQFLPSSVRRFAIDGDDDGKVDLAGSPADAIASVANFLAFHGWEKDAPVTVAAKVNGEGFARLIAEGILPQRTPAAMAAFGVEANAAPELPAALIDLTSPNRETEYWLGYRNFYVLTRYNRSSFYAMAVNDLAQALKMERGL